MIPQELRHAERRRLVGAHTAMRRQMGPRFWSNLKWCLRALQSAAAACCEPLPHAKSRSFCMQKVAFAAAFAVACVFIVDICTSGSKSSSSATSLLGGRETDVWGSDGSDASASFAAMRLVLFQVRTAPASGVSLGLYLSSTNISPRDHSSSPVLHPSCMPLAIPLRALGGCRPKNLLLPIRGGMGHVRVCRDKYIHFAAHFAVSGTSSPMRAKQRPSSERKLASAGL